MADKSSQLVLTALSRAAAAAAAVPLHGSKAVPGLFPTTAAGKQAAQRCRDDGYLVCNRGPPLETDTGGEGGTATAVRKKTVAQPFARSPTRAWRTCSARSAPARCWRTSSAPSEARQAEVDELVALARQHAARALEALKGHVEKVLGQFPRRRARRDGRPEGAVPRLPAATPRLRPRPGRPPRPPRPWNR